MADGCLELAFVLWGLKKSVETECGVDMGRECEQLFLVQCYSITELSFCQALFSNECAICRIAQKERVFGWGFWVKI